MGLWSYIKSFFQREETTFGSSVSTNANANASTSADHKIAVLRTQLENYEKAFESIFENLVKIFVIDADDFDESDVDSRIREFKRNHVKTVKCAIDAYKSKYGMMVKEEQVVNAVLIITSIREHKLKVFKVLMKEEPFTNPDYSAFDLFTVLAEGDDYESTLIVFDPLKKLIFESIYHYVFDMFIKACIKYKSTECILALKDTYPDICKKYYNVLSDNDLIDTF